MQYTIGIDISKGTLDYFELSSSKHYQYPNDDLGQKDLIKWIKKQDTVLVVFEATGAYHRSLEATLARHKHPFAKVNPHGRPGDLQKRLGGLLKQIVSMLQCLQKWALF